MADEGLALTALIIAVIALVTSVLQALQQYESTADGYRRCQAPVMGEWSRFTHRHL